jgi:nitroreductase
MKEVTLFEAISTQRQITRFKTDPVPKEHIDKILEAATKAPSGGNTQPWAFIVIDDPTLITRASQIYKDAWLDHKGAEAPPDEPPVYSAARYLAHHMHETPVLILICVDHKRGHAPFDPERPVRRGRYADSIWPAVQNLFLAARALGLGTRLTSSHLFKEKDMKDLLGVPDHVETVAIIPVGYPAGNFGPSNRRPVEEVTYYNGWGNKR